MKLIVCGGRDYEDREALKRAILQLGPTQIAHGAARGADSLADSIARELGIPVTSFPAKWDLHGRSAGYRRNGEMLADFKPDSVLAAPGGNGTADMVAKSLRAGVRVYGITPERVLAVLSEKPPTPQREAQPKTAAEALTRLEQIVSPPGKPSPASQRLIDTIRKELEQRPQPASRPVPANDREYGR